MSRAEMNLRRKNLAEIKEPTPILYLKVINSNCCIKKGTSLIIDIFGLKNGLNSRMDGYTFFGYYPSKSDIPKDENGNFILDFNLCLNNKLEEINLIENKQQTTRKSKVNNNNKNSKKYSSAIKKNKKEDNIKNINKHTNKQSNKLKSSIDTNTWSDCKKKTNNKNLETEESIDNINEKQNINSNNILSKESGNNNINDSINKNNIGRHFVIEYNISNKKYLIKDLGVGFGTFVRLDYIHLLRDNQLINIGQIFIVVNICDAPNNNDSDAGKNTNNSIANVKANQLKLKIYGINNNGDTYYFMPQNRNITIGRYELADIQLNDKLLSQIHCIINYSNEGWKLFDGQPNKPSTNGTWVYINNEYIMYDKMIFRTNQIMFQASIDENKNEKKNNNDKI